jgi:DNA polymerase delta subunit 4
MATDSIQKNGVHLLLGAIKKSTGEYVYPRIANKLDAYLCPDCNKDLIICQGNIRIHYFRHKMDKFSACHRYNYPTDTQIHTDAKSLLKLLFDQDVRISFLRTCHSCSHVEEFCMPYLTDSSTVELEYRFCHNGLKIADVAILDGGKLLYIFEICHKHKTKREDRPEPWFEIDASSLIEIANDLQNTELKINCIRREKCDRCIKQEHEEIDTKNKALDTLYMWLNAGIEIHPFVYDRNVYNFACVDKHAQCEVNGKLYDLILYVTPIHKSDGKTTAKIQKYCVSLVKNSSFSELTSDLTTALEYQRRDIGVYHVDIEWIVSHQNIPQFKLDLVFVSSQSNMPDFIQYIACLRFHDRVQKYKSCNRCKNRFLVDVKFINGKDICKHCDIECEDNVYLCVPYRDKETVKQLGAHWDSKYKKWYVHKNDANMKIAIENWKISFESTNPSSVPVMPRFSKPSPSKKPVPETLHGSRQAHTRGVSKGQPAQQRRLQFDKPEPAADAAAAASSDTEEAAAAVAAAAVKEATAAPKVAVAAGDTAVAAELPLSSSEEKELRGFDLIQNWGACNGLSRAERWNRASKLGLEPPSRIFDLLQRVPSSSAAAQSLLSAYPL